MYSKSNKNKWALFLLILVGIVVGGAAGAYLGQLPYMSWLNFGETFGISQPFKLDLGIISVTLGFTIKFTISGVIGVILAIFVYKKL